MVVKTFPPKDPDAVLDYAFDWTILEWLQPGETISSYLLTIDDGLTLDSDSESDGIVTIWLSGGTHGQIYKVACRISTNLGRTDERTAELRVKER